MKNVNGFFAFVGIFMIFVFILGYSEFQISKEKNDWSILNIEGSEEAEVKPDTASFTISINEEGTNEEELLETVQSKTDQVIDVLKKNNITEEDIETSYLNSGDTYYNHIGEKDEPKSFVNNTIQIKTKNIENIEKVFEKTTKIKGVDFNGLYYELENIEKEKDKLTAKATENAREKADSMAKSLGVKIKGIHSVRTGDGNMGIQPYYETADANMTRDIAPAGGTFEGEASVTSAEIAPDHSIPIFQKKITIRSTVYVDFFIH